MRVARRLPTDAEMLREVAHAQLLEAAMAPRASARLGARSTLAVINGTGR